MWHCYFWQSDWTVNQLPTSLKSPSDHNYAFPYRRPSFEHAGLTCSTQLSLSITIRCFTNLPISISFSSICSTVGRTDLMDSESDYQTLTLRSFYVSVSVSLHNVIGHAWHTKLATSLVGFLANAEPFHRYDFDWKVGHYSVELMYGKICYNNLLWTDTFYYSSGR